VQIRSLRWRGIPIWPPEWQISTQGMGEDGILEDVILRLTPSLVSLTANHLGDRRIGVIILENSAHLEILYHKLQENLGRPLTEIGDLEIHFTPSLPKYGLRQARPRSSANLIKRVVNKKDN
jgi:hypothetical protein